MQSVFCASCYNSNAFITAHPISLLFLISSHHALSSLPPRLPISPHCPNLSSLPPLSLFPPISPSDQPNSLPYYLPLPFPKSPHTAPQQFLPALIFPYSPLSSLSLNLSSFLSRLPASLTVPKSFLSLLPVSPLTIPQSRSLCSHQPSPSPNLSSSSFQLLVLISSYSRLCSFS